MQEIPLNGRHWASLMALAPGAINTGDGSQQTIRFVGRARDDNNWTFDGLDATGVRQQALDDSGPWLCKLPTFQTHALRTTSRPETTRNRLLLCS